MKTTNIHIRLAFQKLGMKKRCFFYDNTEIDQPAKIGIDWLFKAAKTNKYSGVLIAVNVIENLYTISNYDSSLNILRDLDNSSRNHIINGVNTYLILENRLVNDGQNMPLLAIHPSRNYLVALNKIPSISQMLVIPWNTSEVNDWIDQNNALFLGDTTNAGEEIPEINPPIMSELEKIAKRPNQLLRESAERFVKKILSDGLDFDPDLMRRILIKRFNMGAASATLTSEFMAKLRDQQRGEAQKRKF